MRRFALITAFLLVSAPALAEGPAAIPDAGSQRAEASFKAFATEWMEKVRRLEARHRNQPTVKPGAQGNIITYRGYGDDFSVELRPTGHASSPYVGLLRYTEEVYSCKTVKAESCQVAATVPVTEIFRYRDGRWSY